MGFEEAISAIAKKVEDFSATLETEEATKIAVIMSFIAQVLGYDVFDPDDLRLRVPATKRFSRAKSGARCRAAICGRLKP